MKLMELRCRSPDSLPQLRTVLYLKETQQVCQDFGNPAGVSKCTTQHDMAYACRYHLLHPHLRTCFFSFFCGAAPACMQKSCENQHQECLHATRTQLRSMLILLLTRLASCCLEELADVLYQNCISNSSRAAEAAEQQKQRLVISTVAATPNQCYTNVSHHLQSLRSAAAYRPKRVQFKCESAALQVHFDEQ